MFIMDKKGKSLVLFVCVFFIQVTAFAQNGIRITIQKKNIPIIEALDEVERQSKLSVGYNDSQLKNKPAIDLNLINIKLDDALSTILKGTGYTYRLERNYIKIIPLQESTKTPVKKMTGKVVDENNLPLIGVNIQIEGSGTGVITDMNGSFALEQGKRSINVTLCFSLFFDCFYSNDLVSCFFIPSTCFSLSCHSQFNITLL